MTANKPSHLVPKLRFPEFKDAPEWDVQSLEELEGAGQIELGRGKVISHEDMRTNPGMYPVYSSSVIDEGLMGTYGEYLFDEELISWSVDGGGHFFYRPAHRFSVTNVSGFMRVLRGDIVCRFLAYQLQRLHTSQIFDYQQKAHPSVIRTLYRVGLPELNEQRRIAECLGSLDDMIALEGRKLEALRQHKQGLMQQLFPQPGETVPCLRFPEFRDKGEWEERKAGSLFVNRVSKGEDGLPIYSVTMHDGMVRRDSLDRNYNDIKEAAGNKKACKNDIVYNMMRMWQGALGVAPADCLVSPAYIVLTPRKHVVSRFFEYLFKLPASMLLLTSYSRGLTKDRLRLYYDDFARIPLRCPIEPEQQRIADCLSSLDTHIAAQARRLDMLCLHKQGLLQQLFPSMEGNE
jgi:type I restriction enzyme, S subunit